MALSPPKVGSMKDRNYPSLTPFLSLPKVMPCKHQIQELLLKDCPIARCYSTYREQVKHSDDKKVKDCFHQFIQSETQILGKLE